jgi:ABC-2 type transport system permease protein
MFARLFAIARKDIYLTYTDRNLLVLMLLTPFTLATIISLAFGGLVGGSSTPLRDIPVVVYNGDAGAEAGGQRIDNGAIFVSALVPPADADAAALDTGLFALTDARTVATEAEARAAVASGQASAAVLIPADFTARMIPRADGTTEGGAVVTVLTSPARPVSGGIVRSVIAAISGQIAASSSVATGTIAALSARAAADPAFALGWLAAQAAGTFQPDFTTALAQAPAGITLAQTVTGEAGAGVGLLVIFGAGQALFFMTFTAMGGSASMLEERRDGTLARLMTTPTPRWTVLAGKLLGTYLSCVVQVVVLFVALTLMSSLLNGRPEFIWGNSLPLLAGTIALAAFAACGLGALVTALSRTPDQANIVSSVIAITLGLLSGVFFTLESTPLAPLARFTPNYWGVDAFTRLAGGDTAVALNWFVLLAFGAVTLIAGVVIFNRRMAA